MGGWRCTSAGPPPLLPRADGITYLFVSNSDNLGATLDLDLLAYFASSGQGFLMEVRAFGQSQSINQPITCQVHGEPAEVSWD